MMLAIYVISAFLSVGCFIMNAIIMYHVVLAAAPQYFTMWAVSTSLFCVSLLITLIAKKG